MPICCIQDPDNFNVDAVMDALKAKKAPAEKAIKVRNLECRELLAKLILAVFKSKKPVLADLNFKCAN